MKKTDIGVVAIMYAVCVFFYSMTVQLNEESQTYPTFTIALLFGLTTLYLIQMLLKAKKYGVENDRKQVFDGFIPRQFFGCVGMIVCYLVLMYFIGFYISTAIFLAAVLLFLKVPAKYLVIVEVSLLMLVYLAFTRFLGVKLPAGELLKNLF